MYRSLIIELAQIASFHNLLRSLPAPCLRSCSRPPPHCLVPSRLRVQWRNHWEAPASVSRPASILTVLLVANLLLCHNMAETPFLTESPSPTISNEICTLLHVGNWDLACELSVSCSHLQTMARFGTFFSSCFIWFYLSSLCTQICIEGYHSVAM
jgi:hypothetical protein